VVSSGQAARLLGLAARQVRRLRTRYRWEGSTTPLYILRPTPTEHGPAGGPGRGGPDELGVGVSGQSRLDIWWRSWVHRRLGPDPRARVGSQLAQQLLGSGRVTADSAPSPIVRVAGKDRHNVGWGRRIAADSPSDPGVRILGQHPQGDGWAIRPAGRPSPDLRSPTSGQLRELLRASVHPAS